MITKMKIPPFVATLGMLYITKGLSLVISQLKPIYFNDAPIFNQMAMGSVLGSIIPPLDPIKNVVLIFFGAAIIAAFILGKTVLGRYTFAHGQQRRSDPSVRRQRRSLEDRGLHALRPVRRAGRGRHGGAPEFGAAGAGRGLRIGCHRGGGDWRHIAQRRRRDRSWGPSSARLSSATLANGLRILSVPQEWQIVVTGTILVLAVYLDRFSSGDHAERRSLRRTTNRLDWLTLRLQRSLSVKYRDFIS